MRSRELILRFLHAMQEGQCVIFDRDEVDECFPLMGEWRTSRERLLSNLMGSAWGGFTVEEDPIDHRQYRICRHAIPDNPRRVYVDPDREHLFERDGSGYLVWRGE